MLKRSHMLRYGAFFLLLGVLDFFVCQTVPELNDRHRQLLTDISSHRGYGTHYVKLMVGSPPQMLRLAVATGSDYTSFPCQGCYTCDEPHFQYTAGTEHQCPSDCLYPESICQDGQGGCHLTVTYSASDDLSGEGYKGFEVTDYAFVDTTEEVFNQHPDIAKAEGFPLNFICQEEVLGNVALSDGYLGMSTSPLSFVNQLHKANKIQERVFSLCFRQFDDYEPFGQSAGHVTLGHVDRDLLDSPLVWAANNASPDSLSSYAVHIRGLYFGRGGKPDVLTASAQGTMSILPVGKQDSGSSVDFSKVNGTLGHVLIQTNQPTSYLDSSIEEAFKSAFHSMTGMDYNTDHYHFAMTDTQYNALPTLFIQIEAHQSKQNEHIAGQHIPGLAGRNDPMHPFDVLLAIPPEHYIIYVEGLAFPTLRFGSQSRIASNILQHHEVVFDLDHDRIGFAERRHCPHGMSMMTPLIPNARSGPNTPSRPTTQSTGTTESGESGRPLEGLVEEETTTDGTVLVPENRDFEVVGSDSDSATQSNADVAPASRTAGDPQAVGAPASRTAGDPQAVGTSATSSSGNGHGLNGELDDTERDSNGSNTTYGLSGELDDGGASGGGRSKGRNSGGQQVGQGSGGGAISDHFQPGVSAGDASEQPLVEPQDGLPHPQTSGNSQALRIGPGAVSSAQALGDVKPKKSSHDKFNGYFNILGFVLFSLGFCVTVIFTEDSNALYAYVTNHRDDASLATKAWRGGKSFYNTVGTEKRVVRKDTKMRRQDPSKKGWLPFKGSSASVGDSGSSKMSGKLLDDTYVDDAYYNGDDRSYYTRDDRTEYTRDDRSYYTERPYYDNGGDQPSYADESSGSYYQPYKEYEAKMSGSDSRSARGDKMLSQRPYYDFSQKSSRSSRSLYSQKSFRSMQSDTDESSYDQEYGVPQKSHFEDYNQSGVFNHSVTSFASEEDEYVVKKPDIRKFIKPVNSDDRSVFTSSTGSYSALSKELSSSKSRDSRDSRSRLEKGVSARSGFSGDGTYDMHSQYDDYASRGGTYVPEEGSRYGLERVPSTRSEFTRDGTYYTYGQYDDPRNESFISRGNESFVTREDSRRPQSVLEREASARSGFTGDDDYNAYEQYDNFDLQGDFGSVPRHSSGGQSRSTGRDESQVSSQDPRMMASFRSLESSTRDGSQEDTTSSSFQGSAPTLPPPPPPSSAPGIPVIHHPEPDDYSDVESFYVDEVSVAKFKGVRK